MTTRRPNGLRDVLYGRSDRDYMILHVHVPPADPEEMENTSPRAGSKPQQKSLQLLAYCTEMNFGRSNRCPRTRTSLYSWETYDDRRDPLSDPSSMSSRADCFDQHSQPPASRSWLLSSDNLSRTYVYMERDVLTLERNHFYWGYCRNKCSYNTKQWC